MISSEGQCNTMGTASTMGLLAEALGSTMPGTAGTPATDARLWRHRTAVGDWRSNWPKPTVDRATSSRVDPSSTPS